MKLLPETYHSADEEELIEFGNFGNHPHSDSDPGFF